MIPFPNERGEKTKWMENRRDFLDTPLPSSGHSSPGRGRKHTFVGEVIIRKELASDVEAISEITRTAFENCPHGDHTEQFIIDAFRAANALTVSPVAGISGKMVGHIAFSPVTVSGGNHDWYGLGPVSVSPELQKQGIGKALVNEGLSLLKDLGAKGCVLVGDPGTIRGSASEMYLI